METTERQAVSSSAEDRFVDLFAQTFGLDKVQLLAYDQPFEDIYGRIAIHRLRFEYD
ncbi:MAG: hypothetical protein R3C05_13940 [Pirellulaceae bacterium]